MVRQWQEFFYEKRYSATPISSPDFAALAAAYGLPACTVTSRSGMAAAIDAVRASPQGGLIDFRVEREEAVYPMVPSGADIGDMIRRPAPSPAEQATA